MRASGCARDGRTTSRRSSTGRWTSPQQRYDQLLKWWVERERARAPHVAGQLHGEDGCSPASAWPASEIIEQIRLTRAQPGATGNVHFSMKVFLDDPDGLNERLMAGPYAQPALVPATPWLGVGTPPAPIARRASGRHDASPNPRHPAHRDAAGADRRRRTLHGRLDAVALGRADAERRGMDDGDRSRCRALASPRQRAAPTRRARYASRWWTGSASRVPPAVLRAPFGAGAASTTTTGGK